PKVNECQVVELADGNGTLLMNMRSYFGRARRTHAISYDGGLTWTDPEDAAELVEPVCQASILRYSWPDEEKTAVGDEAAGKRSVSRKRTKKVQGSGAAGKSILLFLNPASTSKRHNMTLRASYDEGKTWPVIKTLFTGPSAYSSLGKLPDGAILCLYEAGIERPYETIIFQKLDPADLLK
ncbi:MAG TPA: sialidase family protein, partial [Anseongella sp.]|nr:sialidase family protein [Anseongella sp.]